MLKYQGECRKCQLRFLNQYDLDDCIKKISLYVVCTSPISSKGDINTGSQSSIYPMSDLISSQLWKPKSTNGSITDEALKALTISSSSLSSPSSTSLLSKSMMTNPNTSNISILNNNGNNNMKMFNNAANSVNNIIPSSTSTNPPNNTNNNGNDIHSNLATTITSGIPSTTISALSHPIEQSSNHETSSSLLTITSPRAQASIDHDPYGKNMSDEELERFIIKSLHDPNFLTLLERIEKMWRAQAILSKT